MNADQEQSTHFGPKETGEGIFALTAPGAPTGQAVAFIVQPEISDPAAWTEKWVYSAAYTEPSADNTPESYEFTFIPELDPGSIPTDPGEIAQYLDEHYENFREGPIYIDTHVVTRQIVERPES